MITYQVETYNELIEDIVPILEDHYMETELYADRIPLNPDYNMYQVGNDVGIIHFYTARDNGALVGYIIMMLAHKPHAKDSLYAMCDMIYVDPAYRSTEVAPELIQFMEAEVKGHGAEVVIINVKAHLRPDSLMQKLAYKEADVSFSKYLKE